MGCRTAKFENDDVWIVYQSTSGANFRPMFNNEIAAELFASCAATSCPTTDAEEMRLAADCCEFLRVTFGEGNYTRGRETVPEDIAREIAEALLYDAEERKGYSFDDLLSDYQCHKQVADIVWARFYDWRKANNRL